jgi:hypothetical protein
MNGWFIFVLLWIIALLVLGIVASYVDVKEEYYKATAISFKRGEATQQLLSGLKCRLASVFLSAFPCTPTPKSSFSVAALRKQAVSARLNVSTACEYYP